MEWIVFAVRFVSNGLSYWVQPGSCNNCDISYRLTESHERPEKSESEPRSFPLLFFESTRAGRLGPAGQPTVCVRGLPLGFPNHRALGAMRVKGPLRA